MVAKYTIGVLYINYTSYKKGEFYIMVKAKVWIEHLYLSKEIQAVCALMLLAFVCIANIGTVKADTIFDGIENGSGTIVSKITDTYCNYLFPFLLVVALVGTAITARNQKLLPLFTGGLKIICIVFVGCKAIDLITGTLEWITEQFSGSAGGSPV